VKIAEGVGIATNYCNNFAHWD